MVIWIKKKHTVLENLMKLVFPSDSIFFFFNFWVEMVRAQILLFGKGLTLYQTTNCKTVPNSNICRRQNKHKLQNTGNHDFVCKGEKNMVGSLEQNTGVL